MFSAMSFTPQPNEFQPPAQTPESVDHPAEQNSINLPATSGLVSGAGPGEYLGYTIQETSGSASAKVTLYDSKTTATGDILDEITVASGQSLDLHYERPGRQVNNGIYAQITGAVAGAVFQ